MGRRSMNKIVVPAALLFLTAIPTIMAAVRVVQIPAGTTPDDVAYLMTLPLPYWLHAAAGVAFGIIGPLQFGRVLAGRFGWLHKALGRVFVVAGAVLGLSGLRLLLAFHGSSTWLLDAARITGGIALLIALALALRAIQDRDVPSHRAWMIRAYAIGVGQSLIAFILFPIYLITGEPPVGLLSDLTVVISWAISIWLGEYAIRRAAGPAPMPQHA